MNAAEPKTILHEKLNEFRSRNPRYSIRSFSKKVGVSSGALSEILKGTRKPSPRIVARICDRLNLDPVERDRAVRELSSEAKPQFNLEYIKLSQDQFHMMSEWYYFAILTLMKVKHFKSSVSFVARRLGLSLNQAQIAVDRLFRLKMIEKDETGTWKRGTSPYRTSDDLANQSIRNNHLQSLELAGNALMELAPHERDFTSITLPLDYENLTEAKEMIRKFQTEFYQRFNHEETHQDVFRLAIQLFPLTQQDAKVSAPEKIA